MIKKIYKFAMLFAVKYGEHICIKPTMKCSLRCEYCIVTKTTGKTPQYKEVNYKEWIELIDNIDPSVITFSGGEPLLYDGIEKIVNYATKKCMFVCFSTNLLSLNGLKFTNKRRIFFFSTYHKKKKELFDRNYKIYKRLGYNVSVYEFGEKTFEYSKFKKLKDKQSNSFIEIYSPDLRKWNNHIELELNGNN